MKAKSVSQQGIRKYSPPASWLAILLLLLLLGGIILPANVFAAPPSPSPVSIVVNCPGGSINTTLASLDPLADNTIHVFGACTENVDIESFERLTLIAHGASITDASGGAMSVLSINDSTHVTVPGFTINGSGSNTGGGPNGPTELIDCNASSCYFSNNIVQGGGDGVDIFNGARAFFTNDVFQDLVAGAIGMFVSGNSVARPRGVTIQRVAGDGVHVVNGAFLQITNSMARGSTVRDNAGNGIVVNSNGVAQTAHTTITGNAGDGIDVIGHSTLRLGNAADTNGTSITGNHGVEILVKDLSFANFPQGVPNVVKNNLGRKDVLCSPQFPATRGALTNIGGGKTNCEEDDK